MSDPRRPMFDPDTLRHTNDPDTSTPGAEAAAVDANQRRQQVYDAIRIRPMAAFELDAVFPHWPPRTGARRLSDLKRQGRVERTGERRRTENGGYGDVYRIVR